MRNRDRDYITENIHTAIADITLGDKESSLSDNILENFPEALCIIGLDLKIIWANQKMINLLNLDKTIKGKSCSAIFFPDTENCKDCPSTKALVSGQTERKIFYYKTNENDSFRIELTATPLKNESSEIHSILAIAKDISFLELSNSTIRRELSILRSIFNSPAGKIIYAVDKTFNFIVINSNVNNKFRGLWIKEVNIGDNIIDSLVNDKNKEVFREHISEALNGKRIRKDIDLVFEGENRVMESIFSPIYDGDGEVCCISIYQGDISNRKKNESDLEIYRSELEKMVEIRTMELNEINKRLKSEIQERKELHAALHKSSEMNKAIFEGSKDPMLITDLDDNVIFFNSAFEKTFGYNIRELIGRPFPGSSFEEPEVFKLWLEKCRTADGVSDYDTRRYTKNGELIDVSITISPIKDMSGKLYSLSFMYRDITKRKDAERALLESEQKYKILVDNSLVGIYVARNFIIQFCNRKFAEIFGYSDPRELVGQNIKILVADQSWEQVTKEITLRETGKKDMSNYDFVGVKKDGAVVDLEVYGRNLNYNGRVVIQGALIDISLRKQAERALKELNASKDKFFSIIAHDLKVPISGFLNLTEMLLKDFGELTLSEIQKMSQALNISASHLYKLLENLLEWSSSQTSRIRCKPEMLDVYELAMNNIFLIQDVAKEKNITIQTELKRNTFAFFDYDMINTVLRNLMSNAVKFTYPGGYINIDCIENDNHIELFIKDNGVGIDQKIQDELFKIDYHNVSLGTKQERGTGLGLILCNEFIRKHGGKIKVESAPGKGSVFSFTLPKNDS